LYSLAAMVEFFHTPTLLHDDVVDVSDSRRGRATPYNLFGNAAAVLVGDFLYTRAFQLMVHSDSMRVLEVMADATNIIAEGEVMQLMNIGNTDLASYTHLTLPTNRDGKKAGHELQANDKRLTITHPIPVPPMHRHPK
ncbi:polyprenyl synthetase family protein, partial [Neisseria meningitidis]|uniref:polyprenyl synthetase family protein n=1 Tax=Neisseria meningitidis TaxID=487 RepID=UPI0021C19834